MLLVKLKKPVKIRHMYQPIGVSGIVSIKPPAEEAFGSVYVVEGDIIEDVTFKDLDLGR